jgi:hypothetical protein
MPKGSQSEYNLTRLDLVMSSFYLPILIETAIAKKKITYGELVTESKARHPNNQDVQRSVPLNVGRRLDALRELFNEGDMPDLSCLVVSKGNDEVGNAYHLDAVTERVKVYGYDWSIHQINLQAALAEKTVTVKSVPSKNKKAKTLKNPAAMTREKALQISVEFWRINKALFPVWMRNKREDIISLLLEGHAVENCYKKVLEKGEKQKQPKK